MISRLKNYLCCIKNDSADDLDSKGRRPSMSNNSKYSKRHKDNSKGNIAAQLSPNVHNQAGQSCVNVKIKSTSQESALACQNMNIKGIKDIVQDKKPSKESSKRLLYKEESKLRMSKNAEDNELIKEMVRDSKARPDDSSVSDSLNQKQPSIKINIIKDSSKAAAAEKENYLQLSNIDESMLRSACLGQVYDDSIDKVVRKSRSRIRSQCVNKKAQQRERRIRSVRKSLLSMV
ncbi:unnamed protein product [Moneuplotes crassus]|uniref:Uncharacterized protein n=1 Tax=Euplotes crassus TaxID=5936 RepID=A0AAD1UBX0_EUPCR|nr:unnamed protein product [Moneuplotes crassus]